MTDPELERQLVALAHDFAANEIRPVAAAFDDREAFPADVVRKAAAVGLTSFDLPTNGLVCALVQLRFEVGEAALRADLGAARLRQPRRTRRRT